MIYLREVHVHGKPHYYLFYTKEKPRFKKYKKYIGTKKPSDERLKKLKNEFLDEIKNHPEKISHGNVITLLQKVQNKKNYISDNDIVKLSKELDVPAVKLYGVLTFYSQFKLNKPGKYQISICNGTACHIKNSGALQKYLEDYLGIKASETTKDGLFSLESVNCIGACARAPAMMINGTVYGQLTKEKINDILKEIQR